LYKNTDNKTGRQVRLMLNNRTNTFK